MYLTCWMQPLQLAEAKSCGLSEPGWRYPAVSHSPFWGAWKFSCLGKPVHWVGALDFCQPFDIKVRLKYGIICVNFDRVVF